MEDCKSLPSPLSREEVMDDVIIVLILLYLIIEASKNKRRPK